MNTLLRILGRFGGLIAVLFVGLAVSFAVAKGIEEPVTGLPWSPQFEAPLPHQIPKTPGAVSLRFAMVHDIIHERYAKHGRAYYETRNRQVRQALQRERAAGGKPSTTYFALLDDLGVGLDELGERDEAIKVMRAKLTEQTANNIEGLDLYTTYANLGTFLIHGHFRRAQAKDAEAAKGVREGLAFVQKAIDVNPDAHFGREKWQMVVVEFLVAAIDNPELLLECDFAGTSIKSMFEPFNYRSAWIVPETPQSRVDVARQLVAAVADVNATEDRLQLRNAYIPRIGAQYTVKTLQSAPKEPVPFDEPVLGVIGMWRQGDGATPHFCLFLGETMARVRQRRIAWAAYQRAKQLADRFWPDPELQKKFMEHCDQRQQMMTMFITPEEYEKLPTQFAKEWEIGTGYQKSYQDYEKQQIDAGVDLDDLHFYDAFHQSHGPIASPVGKADTLVVTEASALGNWPAGLVVGGVVAIVVALGVRVSRS